MEYRVKIKHWCSRYKPKTYIITASSAEEAESEAFLKAPGGEGDDWDLISIEEVKR